MRRTIPLLALLLPACTPYAHPTPQQLSVRSSSAPFPPETRPGPGVYVPTQDIASPAGSSKVCTPDPNGLGAECKPTVRP